MTAKFIAMAWLTPAIAFAHGEDKLGPHNGHIRMPGAFHTELVQDTPTEYRLYLLDINWQNPTVEKSKVHVVLQSSDGKTVTLTCAPSKESYQCNLPKEQKVKVGDTLFVTAERQGAVGGKVSYELPLKLSKRPTAASETRQDGRTHGHK